MTQSTDVREPLDVVFLDFARASDSVNHPLDAYGVHWEIIEWAPFFLTHRFFRDRVHDAFSLPFSAGSFVSQGSVIGPLLFLRCNLPDLLQGKVLLFADDVSYVGPPA